MTEPFFPAECRETICCSIMIILNCTIRSERTITSLQRQRSFYTYRESKAASDYLFDCKAIQSALSEKFGGNWFILFRTHYFVMNQLNNAANYIDASNYPDMQELLYAADVLITDYSSSMWDFSLTRRPCFLYATDLNYYDLDRGFYSDIHTWPYPLAESNSALIKNIKQFNNDQYQKNIQKHWDALGSYESGHACETVANYILTSNT